MTDRLTRKNAVERERGWVSRNIGFLCVSDIVAMSDHKPLIFAVNHCYSDEKRRSTASYLSGRSIGCVESPRLKSCKRTMLRTILPFWLSSNNTICEEQSRGA